jgi:hypothetical protein
MAQRAFAPTSLINAVGGGRWACERLSRLVRTSLAFSLDLAGSPGEAVVLVRRALDEARDGAAT